MVEYIYDIIRAVANEPIVVGAEIVDTEGNDITTGCALVLFDNEMKEIGSFEGEYKDNWIFTIPAQECGRYWYRITQDGNSLSFARPLYVMEV